MLTFTILVSCGPSAPRGKQPYIGGFGEAMVVCSNSFWESDYGVDSLQPLLAAYVPAAMPAQQQLDITQIEPKFFVSGSPLKFRTVIRIDIGDKEKNQTPNISFTTGEHD